MTKEELELDNKRLRGEVDFLRNLVNQLSVLLEASQIVEKTGSPVVYPLPVIDLTPLPVIDLTPRIGWPITTPTTQPLIDPITPTAEPWPFWKQSEVICKTG